MGLLFDSLIFFTLIAAVAQVASGAPQCQSLKSTKKDAPAGADYGDARVTLTWLKSLGLSANHKYGCVRPDYDTTTPRPKFNFAYDCSCASHETCAGETVEYVWEGVHYQSQMGECTCCAVWLIVFLCVVCLTIVIGFFKRKLLMKFAMRLYNRVVGHRAGGGLRAMKSHDSNQFSPDEEMKCTGPREDLYSPSSSVAAVRTTTTTNTMRTLEEEDVRGGDNMA
eukprot:PhM_4_TR10933/c0_g1_i1/m.40176